jgi:hypothetical protein
MICRDRETPLAKIGRSGNRHQLTCSGVKYSLFQLTLWPTEPCTVTIALLPDTLIAVFQPPTEERVKLVCWGPCRVAAPPPSR